MSVSGGFQYTALDKRGHKSRGFIDADTAEAAHGRLVRAGMAPLALKRGGTRKATGQLRLRVAPRLMAEFLFDLAMLVEAGASLRSALAILETRSGAAKLQQLARGVQAEIAGGRSLEDAFANTIGAQRSIVPGLIAAGEASGRLGPAFRRASESIEQGLDIAERVIGAVSYPAFVLLLSASSIFLLLFFVVPGLEPLLAQSDHPAALPMRLMIALSAFLRAFSWELGAGLGVVALGALLAWRAGLLTRAVEHWLLDGPLRPAVAGLVYGEVCTVFGQLLSAGVPATEGIRICIGATRFSLVGERLGAALKRVHEGERVSDALGGCRGIPDGIVRMAAIGEESGALGAMIERAGRIEQTRALRFLKGVTQWLGPALIIALGIMVGGLMGGLLSTVAGLGDTALN